MRPASIDERRRFYAREFNPDKLDKWLGWSSSPIVFAVVIGRHTGIFPREYRSEWRRTILIDEYKDLREVKRYLVEFRPESAYYDRNVYKNWDQARRGSGDIRGLGRLFGQELALDVDPENFECPIHGTLEEKMRRRQGLSFCRLEFQLARREAVELLEVLSRKYSRLRVVYSGRGFHIHILDDETLFWTRKRRLQFVQSLTKRGFLLDEWVATGGMRLIRLPYSLNGLVSRVAIPLKPGEVGTFDPVNDERCLPSFCADK